MGFVKFIIAFIIACVIITKLEGIEADKKLPKIWQAIIGLVIGAGVIYILSLFGL
jgi:hypothetical protein